MDNKIIGEFIKKQRTVKNLTQKQLAEKLGVTDKAISRWETGRAAELKEVRLPMVAFEFNSIALLCCFLFAI